MSQQQGTQGQNQKVVVRGLAYVLGVLFLALGFLITVLGILDFGANENSVAVTNTFLLAICFYLFGFGCLLIHFAEALVSIVAKFMRP